MALHNTPCEARLSKSEEDGGPLHTSFGRIALLPLSSPETKSMGQRPPAVASLKLEKDASSGGVVLGSGSADHLSYHPSDTSTSSDGDQVTSIVMDEYEPSDIVLTRTDTTQNLGCQEKLGQLQIPSPLMSLHRGKVEGGVGESQAASLKEASFGDAPSCFVETGALAASSPGQQVKASHHGKHSKSPGSPRWSRELKEFKDRGGERRKTSLA